MTSVVNESALETKEKMQSNIDNSTEWKITQSELAKLLEFFPNGLVAIDLETTGLSPLVDKIIEIGAFKITPNGIEQFHSLINPEIIIPPETIIFHQITDEMIKDAPLLVNILPTLQYFLGDLPIVAHNAKFDLGFLVMGIQKNALPLSSSNIFCSCKLARHTHQESANHKLITLVEHLEIPLVNHHRATDDAYACLKVFIKSLEKINKIDQLQSHSYLFNLKDFKDIKDEEFPEHLLPLIQLVHKQAVVEIEYKGGKYKNQFRPVKLTGLINSPEGSVLYARCLLTDIYKIFHLKKINQFRTPTAEQIKTWLTKYEKPNN